MGRCRLLFLGLLAILWIGPADVQADAKPLTNGGFEELGANGFPADWEPVGDEVTVSPDAHSGRYALRFRRTARTRAAETGLNRGWRPDSGEQGRMLSRVKGGIEFWYKALRARSTDLTIQVIPMSARPMEDTGEPRAVFTIPREHIGDGRWHVGRLKYDFSGNPKVRYVHVGTRIQGTEGDFLLDDVLYLARVGPWIQIQKLQLIEQRSAPGQVATLKATLRNTGDEPAISLAAEIRTPHHLHARLAGAPPDNIPPDETASISWTVSGMRDREGRIQVHIRAGESRAAAYLALAPQLELEPLQPACCILGTRETIDLALKVTNRGTASVRNLKARLHLGPQLVLKDTTVRPIVRLLPGRSHQFLWRIATVRQTPGTWARARIAADNAAGGTRRTELMIGGLAPDRQPLILQHPGGTARLVFPKSNFGYGIISVQRLQKGRWQTIGRMPFLSRLTYEDRRGSRHQAALYGNRPRWVARKVLTFRATHTDSDGRLWHLETAFTPSQPLMPLSEGRIALFRASYRLVCNRPARLLAWEGPILYAGEGGKGSRKRFALFPGLEMLEGEEVSSSDLEIRLDHPDRLRYVPHPNKITVPMMAIQSTGVVGLLWDAHQKWDGAHDRPSAVFASPNRFEGYNNHLMGLFVPSVPQWVPENSRVAARSYSFKAGRPLHLESYLMVADSFPEGVPSVTPWIATFGLPHPAPIPHGSYTKEVEFSMQAYLESLWDPEEKQWWVSKGAGPLLSPKGRPMSYCYDLLMGSRITSHPQLRQRYLARMNEVLRLTGGRPSGDDLGFDRAGPESFLGQMASSVSNLIASQGDDGSWRFDADLKDMGIFKGLDYHELGPDNAAELGTCAQKAYEILRYARISGDRRAYQAGMKALRFMRRFHIPRAAQVWEVPVHAPDILAASDAIDAFLEAHRFDGDEAHLRQARRWAEAGLPFLYFWNPPEFLFLRYASIPVFGASWNQWSWFGRPVQWNGLRFAYALLKLQEALRQNYPARKLDSDRLKTIAEGIVRSAMYQQEQRGKEAALWPDSIGAIKGDKAAWIFSPALILKSVYYLLGRDVEPKTRWATQGKERIPVTSMASIGNLSWRGGTIRFTLAYPRGQDGFTLLVGIGRPSRVLLEGRPLNYRPDLTGGQSSGWRYDSASASLCIRVAGDGKHRIEIQSVSARRPGLLPAPKSVLSFSFKEDTDGWLAANDIQDLTVQQERLMGLIAGGDPYLVRPNLKVEGNRYRAIIVRMKVSGGSSGQFYWTTREFPGFAEDKVALFPVIPDGQFHEYRIEVGEHPLWKNRTVTAIRLDPNNGAPESRFEIEWIKGE